MDTGVKRYDVAYANTDDKTILKRTVITDIYEWYFQRGRIGYGKQCAFFALCKFRPTDRTI